MVFGSNLVASGWLSVAKFWWKLLCVCWRERQKGREEREMAEMREKLNFLYYLLV